MLVWAVPLNAPTISSTRRSPSCSSCCVSTPSVARSAMRDESHVSTVSALVRVRVRVRVRAS